MEILYFLANISKKYTKYTNLGLALPLSCKWTLIKYKVRSLTPIFAQNENVL